MTSPFVFTLDSMVFIFKVGSCQISVLKKKKKKKNPHLSVFHIDLSSAITFYFLILAICFCGEMYKEILANFSKRSQACSANRFLCT